MADQTPPGPTYHVLLIGVDDYPAPHALAGCVNDIDIVQQVLLGDRMGLAKERITRLASPIPGSSHETTVPETPATLDNIRKALAELGSDKVSPADRVFIYYSGHGARVDVSAGSQTAHREALVPVDYNTPPGAQYLYDFEINEALRKIIARTRSVTAVLDCCFAAGATRGDSVPRYIAVPPLPSDPAPATKGGNAAQGVAAQGIAGIDDCHVVSACMNHEVAREDISNSKKHGLLTRSFIDALDAATDAELPTVTWSRIWQPIQAHIKAKNPSQTPWMSGSAGRAVFGGPPVIGDPGIPVTRDRDGYRIGAGTLAGITRNAVLAIYGEQPRAFPELGSTDDLVARKGLIQVVTASDAEADAVASGEPLELPAGARGRLVKAGDEARLLCAVVPPSPALQEQLQLSPLLQLVDASRAAVKLEQRDDRWFVTDDIHGTSPPAPVLFALPPDPLDCARAVLEQYHAYSRTLRIAALTKDAPRDLELTVLRCLQPRTRAQEAQQTVLEDAPSRGKGTYALISGTLVCFQVRNRSPLRALRVTLVNAAASGMVQLLGDQVIGAGDSYVFWANNNVGSAIAMIPPRNVTYGVDRLIAIGRTQLEHDLEFLRVNQTFADTVGRRRGPQPIVAAGENRDIAPDDYWTTASVIIETRET